MLDERTSSELLILLSSSSSRSWLRTWPSPCQAGDLVLHGIGEKASQHTQPFGEDIGRTKLRLSAPDLI